jgi:hypothetical protein
MNSRKRIKLALDHKEPEGIPVDFGSTTVTGISASIVSKLRDHYGLSNDPPVKVIEPYQMLGELADDLKEVIGIDCVELSGKNNMFGFENTNWKEWKLFDGTPVLVPELFNTKIRKDGSILQYPQGDTTVSPSLRMPKGGYFFDAIIRQPPFDDNNLNVEDNLEEFNHISDAELKYFGKKVDYLYKNTDFAIVMNIGGISFGDIAQVPAPSLKNPKGIRDIQEWYISTVIRKDYIYEVFNRQCDIAIENLKKIYQVVLDKVSVVVVSATDFGTQRSLFISNDSYRELFKPFHKRINDWIHKNTKSKTFIHSDGAIEPLISEFIDEGFDILNPVQCSVEGMDPAFLKEKYGKDIVFWGGGVDTQKTLPFGSSKEVRKEVEERIKIFSNGGGFVFSTIHNIQAGTPIENIVSMIEVIKEYKK